MSVRKKLDKPTERAVDIDALIEKGAKVKEDRALEEKKWTTINIRLRVDMLADIDAAVDRRVGITRTGWILEALHEKVKRSLDE